MHVKLQTWFPFTVQVYVNGHEWLARKLAARGITFEKHDNAFVELADVEKASECARGFWRRDWPKLLDRLADRVHPLLRDWLAGQNYYWVIDQAEFSTDVLFTDKKGLASLRRSLYQHAVDCFGAEQVMTFLGRKYSRNISRGKCERTGVNASLVQRSSTGSRVTRLRCMTRQGESCGSRR